MRVVHCKREPYTKYIGRGSLFGNPFTHLPLTKTKALVQVTSIADAIGCFEKWARGGTDWDSVVPPKHRDWLWQAIDNLRRDDVLGCYCAPKRCHGEVIMKLWEENKRAKQYTSDGILKTVCPECGHVDEHPGFKRIITYRCTGCGNGFDCEPLEEAAK